MFARLALLSLAALAGADELRGAEERQLTSMNCMLDVTGSIQQLMEAGTFLWSALERCETVQPGHGVRCSSDVLSTMSNLLRMVDMIVKGVHSCGDKAPNTKCGATSLKLLAASTGLSGASLQMSKACKPPEEIGYGAQGRTLPLDDNVACMGNIAGAVTSLGQAIAKLSTIKKSCSDPAHCMADVLDVFAIVGHMGECIWQTLESSCIIDKALAPYNTCVQAATEGVKQLAHVASAGLTVADDCKMTSAHKLYDASAKLEAQSQITPLNVGLAALFPLTAVAAFVRGTDHAKKSIADNRCLSRLEQKPEDQALVGEVTESFE